MKKRVMNKRGQELTLGTVILLVLGVIVLVFLILGFSKGWNYVFDKLGFLPDDLNSAAQVCETYAASDNLKLSFCQFRELTINGKEGWYNCEGIYDVAVGSLGEDIRFGRGSCDDSAEYNFCLQLKETEGTNFNDKTLVNEDDCNGWGIQKEVVAETCGSLKGKWALKSESCPQNYVEKTGLTTSSDVEKLKTKKCCVPNTPSA